MIWYRRTLSQVFSPSRTSYQLSWVRINVIILRWNRDFRDNYGVTTIINCNLEVHGLIVSISRNITSDSNTVNFNLIIIIRIDLNIISTNLKYWINTLLYSTNNFINIHCDRWAYIYNWKWENRRCKYLETSLLNVICLIRDCSWWKSCSSTLITDYYL